MMTIYDCITVFNHTQVCAAVLTFNFPSSAPDQFNFTVIGSWKTQPSNTARLICCFFNGRLLGSDLSAFFLKSRFPRADKCD